MNLRRLDIRMALPAAPRTALVVGDLPDWRDGLQIVGIDVLPASGTRTPDLTVAPARLAAEAIACGSPMVILEGRGGRRVLRSSRLIVERFLPLPPAEDPDLLVPLAARVPTAYALRRLRPQPGPAKRVRNLAVEAAIALGAFPSLAATQTIARRLPGSPFLLAPAAELGVDPHAAWFLTLGQGDALTRGVFHLFPARASSPRWVVKFARIPGYADPFERDERGLSLASAAGGPVARHAPRLLGRFEAGGVHASAETAASGERLSSALVAPTPRTSRLASIERIAAWTLEVARATMAAPQTLEDERRRLREQVVARWTSAGAPGDLVDRVPPVPSVLQHNDLGTWNILVDGDDFVAVDWESARRHGMPLWDLLYFAVDALPILGGARSVSERVDQALRLLRGELDESRIMFGWIRAGASAADVPRSAVGAVATLCWLHHGLSHVGRWAAAEQAQPGAAKFIPPVEQIASHWLRDPRLGPAWPTLPR